MVMFRTFLMLLFSLMIRFEGTARGEESSAKVTGIKKAIDMAGKHYKNDEFDDASDQINLANKLLAELLDMKMEEEDFEALKKIYPRLKKAHGMISDKVTFIDKLVPLPSSAPTGEKAKEQPMKEKKEKGKISFTKQIGPLLIKNCGGCHVQGNKGNVNFATFQALADSPRTLIVAGEPQDSKLLAIIESNKMPPRKPLNEKDRKLIRQWIEEGAEFDGKNPEQPLGKK